MLKLFKNLAYPRGKNCISANISNSAVSFASDKPKNVNRQIEFLEERGGFSEEERMHQLLEEIDEANQRKLKEWRKPFAYPPVPTIKGKPKHVFVDRETGMFEIFQRDFKLTPEGLKEHLNKKALQAIKHEQRYIEERHSALGPNLATAHFLIYRKGRVKFKGNDEWISEKNANLPDRYDKSYELTHVDATGCQLHYEALDNFSNLFQAEYVSFAKNELLDDWYLDKISSLFPSIKELDISQCPGMSERGLEAFYRTDSLKKLIVTNFHNSPIFELTCLMLEDCNNDLEIEIRPPENKINDK